MEKFYKFLNKIIIKMLSKSKGRYSVELKKGEDNYLLVSSIKGDTIYCQEWSGMRYKKETSIDISEMKDLSLNITCYDGDDVLIYKTVKAFLFENFINIMEGAYKELKSVVKTVNSSTGGINAVFSKVKKIKLDSFYKYFKRLNEKNLNFERYEILNNIVIY